jgi:uncharacterized membrane protein
MLPELFAISVAISWAVFAVVTRLGLEHTDGFSGAFTMFTIRITILWILTLLFVPLNLLSFDAIFYHAISGTLNVFIGIQFFFHYLNIVGVTKFQTIVSSQTLFAMLFAVLFLNEIVTFSILFGTILIVVGIALLSFKIKDNMGGWTTKTSLLPLIAAICFGFSTAPRKLGVDLTNSPILGVTIETTVGFSLFILYLLLTKKKIVVKKNSLMFFSIASISTIIGLICLLSAMNIGNIVNVVPIANLSPFFTLLFSYLFLRKIEVISLKLIIATIIVVIGIILIL